MGERGRRIRDDYPEQIENLIRELLKGEQRPAILDELAYPKRDMPPRPPIPQSTAAKVYNRDRYMCRYCGGKTILTPIMQLIAELFPDDFPYHPNWKGGQTHPAIIARSPAVDHIEPFAWGGDPLWLGNLATACWPCNAAKADLTLAQLGWQLLDPPQWDWRGLTEHYKALWELAGRPNPSSHLAWMRAISVLEVPSPVGDAAPRS